MSINAMMRLQIMTTLRQARTHAGLSREQLAVAAHVSFSTIARAETGRGKPLPAVREALAAALGLQVDAIDWEAGKDNDAE